MPQLVLDVEKMVDDFNKKRRQQNNPSLARLAKRYSLAPSTLQVWFSSGNKRGKSLAYPNTRTLMAILHFLNRELSHYVREVEYNGKSE